MKLTTKEIFSMSDEKLIFLRRMVDAYDCRTLPCSNCMFLCENSAGAKHCAKGYIDEELEIRGNSDD